MRSGIRTIGKARVRIRLPRPAFSAPWRAFATYRTAPRRRPADKRPRFPCHPSFGPRNGSDFATLARRAEFGAPGIVPRSTATAILDGIDGLVFGDESEARAMSATASFIHPALGIRLQPCPKASSLDNTSDAVLATGADGTALPLRTPSVCRTMPTLPIT